jgi:hypothetical protein
MAHGDLPEQKKLPLVSLRIVDQDMDPSLPVEERIDREKTRWAHEVVTDGGRKVPLLVQAAQAQMSVIVPTPLEAAAVEKILNSGMSICGACARCDYAAGQELLKRGAAWHAYEAMQRLIDTLPPWQNLGFCSEQGCFVNVTSPALYEGAACPEFLERTTKRFLRSLGGVIKRIGEL